MGPLSVRYSAFDPVSDVEDFHKRFGINYDGPPRALPEPMAKFRQRFMDEELREYVIHTDSAQFELDLQTPNAAYRTIAFNPKHVTNDLAGMLDALADLVYVALGTAHLQGFNFREAWRRVHEANMAKTLPEGAPSNPEERMKMKIVKPPGWTPPDHSDLVNDHIHTGDEQ